MTTIETANAAVQILDNKKAMNLRMLRISGISVLSDYFILANGTSGTHVKALADELEFKMKEQYAKVPSHIEGYRSNSWIILDYDDIIIHIFTPQARDFYDLDRLWQDGEEISLSL